MQKDVVHFGGALGYGSDTEFVAALAAAGFTGPLRTALEDELWLYGWKVLQSKLRDGSLLRVQTHLPPLYLSDDDYRTLHDSAETRESLAIDTLILAVPFMVKKLIQGKWDPRRSRSSNPSLGTYFTVACAIQFRDAHRAWHTRRINEIRAQVRTLEEATHVHDRDPHHIVENRFRLRAVLKAATLEERLICAGLLADKDRADIASELGISVKALEGRIYRLRQRTFEGLGAPRLSRVTATRHGAAR